MGASSSKEEEQQHGAAGTSPEQQEHESLAASTGSFPMLQNAFSKLSLPETRAIPLHTLEEIFSLNLPNLQSESFVIPECFPPVLANLGPSMIDMFFRTGDMGVCWVDFLRGYNRCAGRMPASVSLNILYKLYYSMSRKADNPAEMEFDPDEDDGKVTGNLKLNDVLMLLWMCWIMERASRIPKFSKEQSTLVLPGISHLITSAFISCIEAGDDSSINDPKSFDLEKNIPLQKLHMWVLTTAPGLARCISQFVQARFQASMALKDDPEPSTSSVGDDLSTVVSDTCILTRGRAWAISLSLRNVTDELQEACFSIKGTGTQDNLLYRSAIDGKGLSRFWSSVEGYHGPMLILVSASIADNYEDAGGSKQLVLAILTGEGFENKDIFYGSSGYLFAISAIFRVFPASGKDKNFIYCHLRPARRVYDPHPKPVGVGFGGTIGNERIFIDEDFAKVTIRHHAVDKTYQPGSLVPSQGFLPTEASVLDVEVWGFGGKTAKQQQDAYKKRESLFSDQRRKVDMKKFASWDDSPEKMMLDMVSDPNRVQREDR